MKNDLKSVAEALLQAKDIALLTHTHPDPDTIGSCFALKAALEKIGKKVTVYTDCPLSPELAFSYDDYVIYTEPVVHELCVGVDCGDAGRIGDRMALLACAKSTANVDHHPTNTNYADINYILPSAAATAEIIASLIDEMRIEVDSVIATRLYTGLTGDTGSFRYSNTTPETMHLAADLLAYGIDNWGVNKTIFENMSLTELKLRAALTVEMRVFEEGKVCAVVLTKEMCNAHGVDPTATEDIVNIPRSVDTCEIAASFKETDNGIKISLRSNRYADVSAIALEFGGGGHKRAAGFVLNGEIEDVVARVLEMACACVREECI